MSIWITLDAAQKRTSRERIATLVLGRSKDSERSVVDGWSETGSTDTGQLTTWAEPVSGRLMLRPAPQFAAWQTTGTGIYERLSKASYTLGSASAWREENLSGGASKFLSLIDGNAPDGHRTAVTTTSWAANRGFYVCVYVGSWGNDEVSALECGWNSSASGASGVSLRLYTSGRVEVWKDGQMVGTYSVVGQGGQQKQSAEAFVQLLLIPMPARDLFVGSNQGGAFIHSFTDLDEDDPTQAITGATNFWWKVPAGKGSVECAPLRYPTTGWRAGAGSVLSRAPAAGDPSQVRVFSVGGTATAYFGDATNPAAAFAPDGINRAASLVVTLTGDGSSTPFVSGAEGVFTRIAADTDDTEALPLEDQTLEARLEVPESPSGVTFSSTLIGTEYDATGLLVSQVNRPLRVELTGIPILDGVTEPPSWDESTSDEARRVAMEARDRWKLLEQYRFTDPVPLDGLALEAAVRGIVQQTGLTDEFDVEESGLTLPNCAGRSGDEWALPIRVGDTAAEWLDRLHETYAANWFMGFVPTETGIVFRFVSPETLGREPQAKFYFTRAQAEADGVAEGDVRLRVLRSWRERRLEPEANDIWVIGMDRATQRPIMAHAADDASQDPTTPPSARPENWLGEVRKYSWRDDSLNTQALVNRCAELLYSRLTPVRVLAEFEAEMILRENGVPVWRGDVLEVEGRGLWRVVSFSTQFVLESGDTEPSRPSRYVVEQIQHGTAEGCGGRLFGTTLDEMYQSQRARLIFKAAGFGVVTSAPPLRLERVR